MYNRITDIVFKENLIVIVTFQSGEVKEYDFKRLSSSYPPYKRLEQEPELFMNGIIAPGGSGIIFDDETDIPCEELYDYGKLIKTNHIEDINIVIANIVSKARDEKRMSQTELARITGIHQAEISKIERGIGNPSIKTLERIAKGLGVKLELFFK